MNKKLVMASVVCLCWGILSCGGSDNNPPVSTSKTLNELTPTDLLELCNWMMDQTIDTMLDKEFMCTMVGLGAKGEEENQETCLAYINTCKQNWGEIKKEVEQRYAAEGPQCDTETTNIDMTACTGVTVGDWSDCVDGILSEIKTLFGDISCESDLSSILPEDPKEFTLSEACQSLKTTCEQAIPFIDPSNWM